ncbi:MAG TPA: flagellar basal body L-ring protein FlgH [Steroidobacteraceae bacterium]|nr:flagellar basal body L-ring protein FlgH [Steroidobacteraceae bacterium]
MRHPRLLLACACAAVLLTGCGTFHGKDKPKVKDDDGLGWAQEPVPAAANGSIYQVGRDVTLFQNPIARHVGDIVTIVLNEATDASKSATTTTTKATTDTMPGISLLGKPVTVKGNSLFSANVADASKFDGEGDSKQSNSLTGYITATVAKVLPNGNLYIKGEKRIWINQGQESVLLSGVIRPIDLASDNSVSSSKVANARISYGGKGAINDANAQGWLARFFNSSWTPF